MIRGEILVDDGDIDLNAGRTTTVVTVANRGDRPIQIGSHYHFAETNAALRFDRARARGFRLNIAAGTAVRFEPGQERTVELVALAGDRIVYGFAGEVMGPLDGPRKSTGKRAAASKNRLPPRAATAARKPQTSRKSPRKRDQ